jgi:hypothetical protein
MLFYFQIVLQASIVQISLNNLQILSYLYLFLQVVMSNHQVNAPFSPNKVLQQVLPIPQITKAMHISRNQAAKVLTKIDFGEDEKKEASPCNQKVKTADSNKKPVKCKIFSKQQENFIIIIR